MSVQPIDLLQLSKQLMTLNSGKDESVKRCVVSRAYYAALHAVDLTFPKKIPRMNGESSHAEIIGRAVARGNQIAAGRMSAKTIANMMAKLRRFRNFADYNISEEIDDGDYIDIVARAEKVLKLCDEFSAVNTCDVDIKPIKHESNDDGDNAVTVKCNRPALRRVK